MPLHMLAALVTVGILGIVFLTHLAGYSGRLRFADEKDALDHWHRNLPERAALRAEVAPSGRVALIEDGKGLVWAMGAGSTARELDGALLRVTEHGLRLRLPDASARSLRVDLPPAVARDWADRIRAARRTASWTS